MTLRPFMKHQQEAFDRYADSDEAAFIMEMRLGKTITAIRWMQHRLAARGEDPADARVLVVAPSTPLVSWQEELDKEGVKWMMIKGSREKRNMLLHSAEPGWRLMQYETIIYTLEATNFRWHGVIADESTAIKNPKSRITKAFLKAFSKASVRAILTGLVNPETLREVWTQFAFAAGGRFMDCSNYWTWQQRHFYKAGFDVVARPGSAAKIKEATHAAGFFLTRAQAGIGSKKIREKLTGELRTGTLIAYRDAVKTWEIPGLDTKHAFVVTTWLRRMTGGHMPGRELECWKYAATLDLLQTQLKGEQVVIWFAFNLELARMWREMKKLGLSATWVSGEVEVPERRRRRRLFAEGKRQYFLCQVACGKYGLDLSAADTEIYFSSPYSFEGRRQSEDRIEHPLKRSPLLVVDLVTERTVDEDVLESLEHKNESAEWLTQRAMTTRRLG
jgi:hypothetical protein